MEQNMLPPWAVVALWHQEMCSSLFHSTHQTRTAMVPYAHKIRDHNEKIQGKVCCQKIIIMNFISSGRGLPSSMAQTSRNQMLARVGCLCRSTGGDSYGPWKIYFI